MNEPEAEILFYSAAVEQASSRGFRLGDGADQQIRDYARKAAEDIGDSLSQTKMIEGVQAFRLLVDTMINVRDDAHRPRPDRLNGTVIGEDTLAMAIGKLCPGLWPFC